MTLLSLRFIDIDIKLNTTSKVIKYINILGVLEGYLTSYCIEKFDFPN